MIMLGLSGAFAGLCFDFYRIVRYRLGLNKVLTFIGDLFFSLAALIIIYIFAQKANFLELRFYLFAASLLGLLIYLRICSRAIKKIYIVLLDIIEKIKDLFIQVIIFIYRGICVFIASLMRVPYGLLRWLGLLLFRMGEAVGRESAVKIKKRGTKLPR